jgi:hypothetical protein
MDPTKFTPSSEPLLRDSFDGFLHLITTVFLDSIVFFTTLPSCILFPRLCFPLLYRRLPQRWKLGLQAQNDIAMFAGGELAVLHAFLCLLFGTQDDLGVTPNAPTVFWAVVWSTGILMGVGGGFLAVSVGVLFAMKVVGI